MMKGNLFIDIEIEFPDAISEDEAKALMAVLPGPKERAMSTDEHETHVLENMDPVASAKAVAAAYEPEEDEDERGGGQGVQCAQQ